MRLQTTGARLQIDIEAIPACPDCERLVGKESQYCPHCEADRDADMLDVANE